MPVTNDFHASELDLNGQVSLSGPTALSWGVDGRLYVAEQDGDVKVLKIAFGDPNPADADAAARFYVTESVTLTSIKAIQNHNDNGPEGGNTNRQVTGIDVTPQFDEDGNPLYVQANGSIGTTPTAQRAVTMYVTSSDSRIGAGGGGGDTNLDTNSGVITMLVQTGANTWDPTDLVRGLPRSEENHATNGLEVVQVLDAAGKLVSERIIVASGGNANAGAPSNNFAGQQEQPLSAAILEVNLSALKGAPVLTDPEQNGRKYVYDLPTLDDPAREGAADANDPFGGADGRNSATLNYNDPFVTMYSPGYRNSFDVEVTEDGRVWTYDNGANNDWGGRPVGEAGVTGNTDNPQAPGYIATNLNNGDGNGSDPINVANWDPGNKDNFHEVTRSDDLGPSRSISVGGVAPVTTFQGPDGLTYVYGGHANPTRAEGARAGLLFSPGSGVANSFLLVSNQDSYPTDADGRADFAAVTAWLQAVENDDATYPTTGVYGADPGELTSRVLAVTPGVLYNIYSLSTGGGAAVPVGQPAPANGTLLSTSPVGLPADIADIVSHRIAVEGDYKLGGNADGSLDSGNGSINGLAEYTSTILDNGTTTMSGAILATQLGGGNIIVMGRNADGTMSSTQSGGFSIAADRTVIAAAGGPLGIDTIGDDFGQMGLTKPFQGSIWTAVYSGNGPFIEIFQPDVPEIAKAGSPILNPDDFDLDGIDKVNDPFEFSATNGFVLGADQSLNLTFDKTEIDDRFRNGSLNDVGLHGAALDGTTPNQDAQTAAEFFPVDQQRPGLFDDGGNLILGGNAPILQIKNVVPGTAIGAGNTARDAMHVGVRPTSDVDRIEATLVVANWIASKNGGAEAGQVTGLMFGDGTQSNFLRVVIGNVGGQPGLEVGYELGDANYTTLAQVPIAELSNVATQQVELRLSIGIDRDPANPDYPVAVSYRLVGESGPIGGFVAVPLGSGFSLPSGVLRDVLNGSHTITQGGTTLPSGAAFGVIAEDAPGGTGLAAIDFPDLKIQTFGNEILAGDGAAVGAAGTDGPDTILYVGSATELAPLAENVENFDGSGSVADFTLVANALDNRIVVGSGANTITTGAGEDTVTGTLEALDGTTITDFSLDDQVVISDASTTGLQVSYASGSAVVTVNGTVITFAGPDFADFEAADGPGTFEFTNTQDGLAIRLVPGETVLYRINAGSNIGPAGTQGTIAAIDGGPDWIGDAALVNGSGPVTVTGAVVNTYTQGLSDQQSEITGGNVDLAVVPWQVFANERSDNTLAAPNLTYNFAVESGKTYKITLFYTENWNGVFAFATTNGNTRQFDVSVEGTVPDAFTDINPGAEAAALLGIPVVNSSLSGEQQQAILGTPLQREFVYTAGDDLLTLQFLHDVENPKVNAIQISELGGPGSAPADTTAPAVTSITVSNEQDRVDGTRTATVVLTDAGGFNIADLAKQAPSFSGIVPSAISPPSINLSSDLKTATLVYALSPPAGGAWPAGAVGTISFGAGAFEDGADNGSAVASAAFVIEPFLSALVRGDVVRAINVGTTDTAPGTLGVDPFGGVADNNRYGGAIASDSIIQDAAGNPIAFEADNNAWYSSPKTNAQLNSNVDGQLGATGSNGGGVDLDGSAYHTYRDSNADVWTGTYTDFANGTYIVELHFAELFHTAAGSRVGDFFINGVQVADNYDAFTAGAGADKPSFLRVPVVVTNATNGANGTIQVTVDSEAGQAGYSAIVVYDAVNSNLPPVVSVDDVTVVEGGVAQVVFTRTGNPTEAITVTFTIAPDAPASGADYTPPTTFTAVIPAGATKSAPIAVPIVDDSLEEGLETLTVTVTQVSNTSGNATGVGATGTITIAPSDSPLQVPAGGTILELDFETPGNPLVEGGFDGALGGSGAIEAGNATIEDGQLVVQTAEGDLNQGGVASKNDFTKSVDLSDPDLTEIFITSRFANPFTAAVVPGGVVPNFAQQGIVFGTGTQNNNELVKLVWGGVAGSGPDPTGAQLWSKPVGGVGFSVSYGLGTMAPGVSLSDVAEIELSMVIDKAANTVAPYITLFDAAGEILGGVRPTATSGFATAAPQALPQPLIANLDSGDTRVGVTSTDFQTLPSFEARWDFLTVTSPQFVEEPPTGADSHDKGGAGGAAPVVVGDFSNDRLAPTNIGELPTGETVLLATQQGDTQPGGRDRDYITFTVPEGKVLTGLFLDGYDSIEVTGQGFLALQSGTQVTVDPEDGMPDPGSGPGPFAGIVYGRGDLNANLMVKLAAGEASDAQGRDFAGIPGGVLTPGTYTLWLNQGGEPTTVTLRAVVADPPPVTLSVGDAPSVDEAGDTGTVELLFPVTASGNYTGSATINFDAGAGQQSQVVVFTNGAGTLVVAVAKDEQPGDRVVSVQLTGASDGGFSAFGIQGTPGEGIVEDDDAGPTYVAGNVVAAFNAGGPALVQDGIQFAAVTSATNGAPFSGGELFTDGGAGDPVQSAFAGTVFATEVNSGAANDATPGTFAFSFAPAGVSPGKLYFVDLYLAEIFSTAVGSRVFDVIAEGTTVLDDVDVLAQPGASVSSGIVVRLPQPIDPGTNGAIDLSFLAEVDRAKVSAIVVREAVLVEPPGTVTIGNAPLVTEGGDTDSTLLTFPLSLVGPDATLTLSFTVGGTPQTQQVQFVNGAASLSIGVPNDNLANGPDTIELVLTDVEEAGFRVGAAATAQGVVAEDDNPNDIDGDGILNIDDPFAYDPSNGLGRELLPGGSFRQDFNTDTTDLFSPEAGFTGIIVNPAYTPPGTSETDPYGDRTTEATSVVQGGSLQVTSFEDDLFGAPAATGSNNIIRDAYQSGIDVTGVQRFSIEARAQNPFPETGTNTGQQFKSFGIAIGAGGVDDYVKFVFGVINAGPRLELAGENSLVTPPSGPASNSVTLPTGLGITALVSDVVFRIDVDKSNPNPLAWTLTGVATLLDAAGSTLGTWTTPVRTITGSLLQALQGQNPLTGNQGGIAYGVVTTDTNNGAGNRFQAQFDYLEIRTPNEPPSVSLANVVTSLAENADTTEAIRVADIVITDEGLGTNTLALTGTDAALFEIVGDGLFLKAGTVLDHEAKASFDVAVTVDDTIVGTTPDGSAPLTLSITDVNDAPTITGTLDPVAIGLGAGTTIPLDGISVGDVDEGDSATLGARLQDGQPLPAEITLENGSLVVATGTAAGTYEIELFATDENGAESTGTVKFTVTVTDAAPTVDEGIDDAAATEDAPFSFVVPDDAFADDGGVAGLTYTASLAGGAALPGWLTFDAATRTFSGTPLNGDVGPIQVVVTANDGTASISTGFTLTVANTNDAPTITGSIPPVTIPAETGTSISLDSLVLDDVDAGDTVELTAELANGQPLPEGFALDGTALTVDDTVAPGTYSIAVRASDGEVESAEAVTVQVTINPPASAGPFRIQAESLGGRVDFFTENQAAADGGQVIRLPASDSGSASISLAGLVPAGDYQLRIRYFDENDGVSQAAVQISGAGSTQNFAWMLNDDAGSDNAAGPQSARFEVFENVTVGADSVLTLTGASTPLEFVRVDYFEFVPVAAGPVNQEPFAPFPIGNRMVAEEAPFSLNLGSFFVDPDEDPLSYTVTLANGDPLPGWLTLANGVLSGTPDDPQVGTIALTVTASDGTATAQESFELTVTPVNDAPVAAVIPQQTLSSGQQANLSLASFFSDPDDTVLTYALTGTVPPGLTFANGVLTGLPTQPGSYALTVSANDGEASAERAFVLNVVGGDPRPVVKIEAETLTKVSGFFNENQAAASGTPAGQVIRTVEGGTGIAQVVLGSNIAPGAYGVRVTYFDENDGVSNATISVDSDGALGAGGFVTLGSWQFNNPGPGNAAQAGNLRSVMIEGLVVQPGAILRISGTSGQAEPLRIDFLELVPMGGAANFAPSALGIDDVSHGSSGPISIPLAAAFTDPEEDPLTYSVVSGQPWLSIVNGVLTGTPPAPGEYEIVVGATDGPSNSGVTTTTSFTLTVLDTNEAPVLLAPLGTLEVAQGGLLEAGVVFDDPEGGALTYAFGPGAPDWLSIDADGVITGVPANGDVGNTVVTVIATDARGATATDTITVVVGNVNDAPTAGAPLADQTGAAGQPFSFTLPAGSFTDIDLAVDPNETLTYSATLAGGGPLPQWLSFDPATGAFTGTPPAAQSFAVVVTATDADGQSASLDFDLNIGGAVDTRQPVTIQAEFFTGLGSAVNFFSQATANAQGNQSIRLDALETGSVDHSLVGVANGLWTIKVRYMDETDGVSTGVVLVDGVQIGTWVWNGTSGEAVNPGAATGNATQAGNVREISFTTPFQIGPTSVLTLQATAGGSELARIDSVTLTPVAAPTNPAPVFTTPALRTAAENQTVVGLVTATDTQAVTYGFGPGGSDNALFTINPTTGALAFVNAPDFENPSDADEDGVYQVVVTASDGTNTTSQTVSVTVTDANDAPVAGAPLPQQAGTVGQPVALPGVAALFSDQDANAVLTYTAAGLPQGVTLVNGAFTGTPTASGTFNVVVTANDGTATATSGFELVVGGGPQVDAPLADGQSINLEFNGTGTPYQAGFTGLLQSPTAGFVEEIAASVSISNGALRILTSNGDNGGGDNGNNNYNVSILRSDDFAVETKVTNPFRTTAPVDFQQLGLHIGLDQDNFVKLVWGEGANTIELAKEEGGAETKLSAGIGSVSIADVQDVVLKLDVSVDAGVATVTALVTLLGTAGQVLGTPITLGPQTLGGALGAALTGGTVPFGVGVTQSHFNNNPQFEAAYDYLRIVAEGGAAVELTPPTAVLAAVAPISTATTSQTLSVTYSDPSGIDLATLGDGDLTAIRSDGKAFTVSLGQPAATGTADGPQTVTYELTDADGTINAADNGTYTIQLASNAVADGLGNAPSTPVILGNLVVAIGVANSTAPTGDLDGDTVLNNVDPDVDGDGIANTDDAFSYDAQNGRLLADGEVVTLDFSTPGTPFQNGFTGLLQSITPGFNELTAGATAATVANGKLVVTASNGDTGGSNNPEDDFQLGIKNSAFTVEGRVDNPFTSGTAANFEQVGIHVGIGSNDFVKLVFGFSGGLNVEFSMEQAGVQTKPGGTNLALPAGLTLGGFAQVDLKLVVDATAPNLAVIQAFGTFLDASGNAIPGATNVDFGSLTATGALAAALFNETVGVGAGFTQTQTGAPDAPFQAQLDRFIVTEGVADEPPPAPVETDPEAILLAAGGVTTSDTYAPGVNGSAVLRILPGSSNVQLSNFGASSFQLENTGGKKVAAMFLDVTGALYGDSNFDVDGSGGDDAAKDFDFTASSDPSVLDPSGYTHFYLPSRLGDENNPLFGPATSNSGDGADGGFRGLLLKFGEAGNGFAQGDIAFFSGDMDPNSIAGLTKGSVDTGAVPVWDVGGVSGAELIGSTVTVMFSDGTFAQGQLVGDGSQAGSHALISQAINLDTAPAASLTVNGVPDGGTGTYGGTVPSVIVTGPVGATVRVVMTKGFDPVANTQSVGSTTVNDLVAARLAQQDFAANNAAEFQFVDVVIPAGGSINVGALFAYNNVPNGISGIPNFAQLELGFSAAVINNNSKLAIGPVSDPIYLENNGSVVVGGATSPPLASAPQIGNEGYFQAQGSGNNVFFKVQFEDPNVAGTNPGGLWDYLTAADADGDQANFQGTGFYLWGSETSLALTGSPAPNSFLPFTVLVPEGQGGIYNLRLRASRETGSPGGEQNDVWVRINNDFKEYVNAPASTEFLEASGFVKLFGGPTGVWGYASALDVENGGDISAQFVLEEGLNTITFAGRSQGYHLDFFELYKGATPAAPTATSPGAPNSTFVATGPSAPALATPIPDQTLFEGGTYVVPLAAFTDADGDTLTYTATLAGGDALPAGLTFNPATRAFTAVDAGTYSVQVTATDDDGNSVSDAVTFTVLEGSPDLIVSAIDDIEQKAGLAPNNGSLNLEFGKDDLGLAAEVNQSVGIRFGGFTIPAGQTIEAAYLQFEAFATGSTPATFTIQIQNSETPAAFGTTTTAGPDAASRTYLPQTITWTPEAFVAGQTYQTPNLAALITQVIGDNGLASNQFLSFRINGAPGNAGGREVHSIESTGAEPRLVIDLGGTPVNTAPTITSAASASVVEGTVVAIDVNATDAQGQPLTYSLQPGGDAGLFTINATTGVVSFATPPNFEAPADAGANNIYNFTVGVSDGIATTTQALAVTVTNNPADDGAGPSLAFQLLNEDTGAVIDASLVDGDTVTLTDLGTDLLFRSPGATGTFGSVYLDLLNATGQVIDSGIETLAPYDLIYDGANLAPGAYTLRSTFVTGTGGAGSVVGVQEVDFTIATGGSAPATGGFTTTATHDAEQQVTGGAMNLTSADLEMKTSQAVGLRFVLPSAIPAGADITNAFVRFQAEGANAGASSIDVAIQNSLTAAAFTTAANNVTSRTYLPTSFDWTSVPNWTAGTTYQTPNIASLLEDLLDANDNGVTDGSAAGASIVLKFAAEQGERQAWSIEGTGVDPVLVVEWTL